MFNRIARVSVPKANFAKLFSSEANNSFEKSVQLLNTLKEAPSNEVKLKIYGLYKQATSGDCSGSRPLFNMVAGYKHDAWKSLQGMSQDSAKAEYSKLVGSLIQAEQPVSNNVTSAASAVPSTKQKVTLSSIAFPNGQQTLGGDSHGEKSAVRIELSDNGIAKMKLNNAAKSNALNLDMWEGLKSGFASVASDDRARVVVLSGEGKNFCSGMDLSLFMELEAVAGKVACEGRRNEGLARVIDYFQTIISAPEACSVPVIVCVTGHCIGGAVDLISACDLRYCTTDAKFCVKEIDLAIVADIGTIQRLPRIINDQTARELTYTGRTIDGKEAERIGLVAKCFDTREEMMQYVEKNVAGIIASKSPLTIRGIKKNMIFSRDHSVKESLEYVKNWNTSYLKSADLRAAFEGIMGKKEPKFIN